MQDFTPRAVSLFHQVDTSPQGEEGLPTLAPMFDELFLQITDFL